LAWHSFASPAMKLCALGCSFWFCAVLFSTNNAFMIPYCISQSDSKKFHYLWLIFPQLKSWWLHWWIAKARLIGMPTNFLNSTVLPIFKGMCLRYHLSCWSPVNTVSEFSLFLDKLLRFYFMMKFTSGAEKWQIILGRLFCCTW